MIDIDIQIKSIIFSFIFGLFFTFLLKFIYKLQNNKSLIIKVLTNLLFAIDSALIYFIIMKKINSGIIHQYFILSILLGVVTYNIILNRLKFTFKFNK